MTFFCIMCFTSVWSLIYKTVFFFKLQPIQLSHLCNLLFAVYLTSHRALKLIDFPISSNLYENNVSMGIMTRAVLAMCGSIPIKTIIIIIIIKFQLSLSLETFSICFIYPNLFAHSAYSSFVLHPTFKITSCKSTVSCFPSDPHLKPLLTTSTRP